MIDTDELKIFSGSSNQKLASEICETLSIPLSKLEISRFSNDNLFVQIQENVREKDVFVVQSYSQPVSNHILEFMIIIDALRSASAEGLRRSFPIIPMQGPTKRTPRASQLQAV